MDAALLHTIRTWGTHEPPLYDASKVADRIPTEHVEARAELFVLAKRPERALDCLLDVQGTSIAPDAIQRLVADHGLFDEVAAERIAVCQGGARSAPLLCCSCLMLMSYLSTRWANSSRGRTWPGTYNCASSTNCWTLRS